jgi:endonuclease/exonuclease/phosphatase family metal-dependent hydrolase
VVGGDLNAAGEREVIREFHAAGLRDPGGGPTNPSIAPRQRLDYVLIPNNARLLDQHEPDGGDDCWAISDHVPVTVEFELPD